MSILKIPVILALLSATAAFAGTAKGQVTNVTVRSSDGLVFFYLNVGATGRPGCATRSYWMIKDENSASGKRQLAMLLAARATGEPIAVYGAGTCTRWADGEDVESIGL